MEGNLNNFISLEFYKCFFDNKYLEINWGEEISKKTKQGICKKIVFCDKNK